MITITKSQIKEYLVKYFHYPDDLFYDGVCYSSKSDEQVVSASDFADFLLEDSSFIKALKKRQDSFPKHGQIKMDLWGLEPTIKRAIKSYPNYNGIVKELKRRQTEQAQKVRNSIDVTKMILKLEGLGYKVTKK